MKGRGPHSSATLTKWADRIDAILKPHADGLSKAQIMNLSGLGESTVNKALRFANRQGRVCWVRTLYAATWYHRDYKTAVIEQRKQASLTRNEQKVAQRLREKEKALNDFERLPDHILVAAENAAPLRPTGPASVWDLAA